ncbi:MAG: O-antigen ligase family protein [Chloroflexi bacterium]|nr:O-antigen ligase family protein [Chloroflexota bacterium]
MRLAFRHQGIPGHDWRFSNAITILLFSLLSGVAGFGVVRALSTSVSVPNLVISFAPLGAMTVIFGVYLLSATQGFGEAPPIRDMLRFSPRAFVFVTLIALPLALLVSFTTRRLGSTDSAIALVTVVAFAGIVPLALIKVNWGLCALLLLLPMGLILHAAIRSAQLATDGLGYLVWSPEMLLVLAAVTGVYLHSLRSKERFVLSWLTPLLLLFLFWSVLSAALSPDPRYSMRVVIAGTLMPVLVYYLVINSIKSREDFKRTVYVLLLSFFLLGAYSLVRTVQAAPGEDVIGGDVRVSPLLLNPDDVGGVLLLGLGLSAAMVLSLSHTFHMRLALIVVSVILAIALVMTFSRGGWLAAVVSLGVLLALNTRFKKVVLVSLPALLVIFALARDFIVQLALARTISLDAFLQSNPYLGRLAAWDSALNMISANPLVGIGPGLYRDFYREFETGYFIFPLADAHSLPLELASNSGIVVAVAFLAVMGILLWMAYRVYIFSQDELMKYSALGLFLALFAFLVYSSSTGAQLAAATFDRLYYFGGHTYYLFAFFGLVSALYRLSRQDKLAGRGQKPDNIEWDGPNELD